MIGISGRSDRFVETTPTRAWTDATGNPVGGARTAAEQILTLTPTSRAAAAHTGRSGIAAKATAPNSLPWPAT
ncbi:hypothetical protein ACH429_25625 [Streptomyces pathocidini]|uniref:Uncharacterized protein n=1 Tax=Streptomyces pathocidini TaxID=1650571 RepID=A0ABW7V011_9ACTN|nr:hypothetical protein [Streptomyces pathocidini]